MWSITTIPVLAAVIMAHAMVRRLRPTGNSVVQFVGIAVLGAGALALILTGTPTPPVEWIAAFALLTFGCELYLFLFTFAISSVSLALLLEKTGGSRQTGQDAAASSPAPVARVARMVESGLLVRIPTGYALSPAGRTVVGVRRALRRFFQHES